MTESIAPLPLMIAAQESENESWELYALACHDPAMESSRRKCLYAEARRASDNLWAMEAATKGGKVLVATAEGSVVSSSG